MMLHDKSNQSWLRSPRERVEYERTAYLRSSDTAGSLIQQEVNNLLSLNSRNRLASAPTNRAGFCDSGFPPKKYINTGYPVACIYLHGQSQAMITPDKPLCNSLHAAQIMESSRSRPAFSGSPAWHARRSSSQYIRPESAISSSESLTRKDPQKKKKKRNLGPLRIAMMAVIVNLW
uniref:Uncharacterized protein n=1 Tax=Cryptomonas curvata TaxID=233186 RepID=A0A7S0N8Z5_9CRYP